LFEYLIFSFLFPIFITPSPRPFSGTLPIVTKKSKRKAGKLAGNSEALLYRKVTIVYIEKI
jgi:hypothetical protein